MPRVLFICTGNTCRSPLAEALCKKMIADRLGCSIADLPSRGFEIESAGLMAAEGAPAAFEAIAVAAELGADLSTHRSRQLTAELLECSDVIIGMTAGHLVGLEGTRKVTRLLCGKTDLDDPIGGDRSVYETCASTIWLNLQDLVNDFMTQSANTACSNSTMSP